MEIEKLAKLARINLSSEEKEKLQKEFEAILAMFPLKEMMGETGKENGNGKCFERRKRGEENAEPKNLISCAF